MAKSLNLCQFIGNVGQEIEMRFTASGSAVANLSLGVSDDYKDKTGKKVEQTNWIRVVAFGKLAEIIGEYLKKGSKIYISGKQVTRKWQAQDGSDRYSTEIVAEQMQMLDSRNDNGNQNEAPARPPQNAQPQQSAQQFEQEFSEDSIPF